MRKARPEPSPADVDHIALLKIVAATKPALAHAATIQDKGEEAFDQLGAQLEGLTCETGEKTRSVIVIGPFGIVIALPAQNAIWLGLADPAFPSAVFQVLQAIAGMIAIVRDQLGRIVLARRLADSLEASSAALSVPDSILVSPWSALWIGAAMIAPVSRSTACSGL